MLMVSLRNIKLFDLKTSIKSRDASDASGARRLGIRKLMLGLIIFNISFTVYAQDNNLEKKVIFIKEEKLLENNLATKRIFYKKCPGLTNFNCFRNILVFNNKFINLDDFTINKNDFEQSVLYEIKEGEILVLNLNFLTRGNSFWQKYFGINEIKDVKYKIKKEKKIDSTLKYIEYQFKISEILIYEVKVDFLNKELLSRNIGIVSDFPYVKVYIIGGERNEMLENKTSIHETEHINELK